MTQHTQEPWAVTESDLIVTQSHSVIAVASTGCGYNGQIKPRAITDAQKKANARRIVACVNACAGVTNEELDHITANGWMLAPSAQLAEVATQRDELLKALERAHKFIDEITTAGGKYHGLEGLIVVDAYEEARHAKEAIDSAKGGAM